MTIQLELTKMTARLKHVRPRLAAVLATVSLVAAATVAGPATPAQAAGTCNLAAPSRWVVSSPYREVVLKVSSDCAAKQAGGLAVWEAVHPTYGVVGVVGMDNVTPMYWDVYDDDTPLGVWTWRGVDCFDGASDPCVQNSPKTDIRLGGWAGLTAVRSGTYVTVSTSSARYAYSLNKFVPWGGIRGTVQTRTSSTSPWVSLKWVYPGANGRYSFRYTMSSARDYRVVFPATTMIWNATSNIVRR